MKINRHIRSKSDTMFAMEQKDLDNIQANLKLFRDPQSTESMNSNQRISRGSETHFFTKRAQSRRLKFNELKECVSFEEFNEIVGSFLLKLFVFKKGFDKHIFEHLSREKHHLNTLLSLIKNDIATFKSSKNLEGEIEILNRVKKFEQCLDIVIQIKPTEYYREIKTMLLNEFEQTRIDIQSFIERCSRGSKLKNTSQYIVAISQIILYLISFVSYRLDYYSLALNCLMQRMKSCSIFYIQGNSKEELKHVSIEAQNRRMKYLKIIEQFVFLSRRFTQEFYGQATCLLYHNKKSVSLNNFSSCGRYVLNNFIQTYSQNDELNINNDSLLFEKKIIKAKISTAICWKNYIHQMKNLSNIKLDKYFRLFFNLKLVVWKNCALKIDKKVKASELCRICEQAIPINDYILHINYCREQRIFYEQNRMFKQELEKIIKQLAQYNEDYKREKTKGMIYNQYSPLIKQLRRIAMSSENILEPKQKVSNQQLLNNLIKIYQDEADLPLDYYEKNCYKFPQVISLTYLTLFLYIKNKQNSNGVVEINTIFSSFFSCLVNRMIAIEYILTAQESKTKSNMKSMLRINEEAKEINEEKTDRPDRNSQLSPTKKTDSNSYSINSQNNVSPQKVNMTKEELWNDLKNRKIKSVDCYNFNSQLNKVYDEENQILEFPKLLNSYKSKVNIEPSSPHSFMRSRKSKYLKDSSDSIQEISPSSSKKTVSFLDECSNKQSKFSLNFRKSNKHNTLIEDNNKVTIFTTEDNNDKDNCNDNVNKDIEDEDNNNIINITINSKSKFKNKNNDRESKDYSTRNNTSMDSKSSGLTPKKKGIPKPMTVPMPQWDESPLLGTNHKSFPNKKSRFGNNPSNDDKFTLLTIQNRNEGIEDDNDNEEEAEDNEEEHDEEDDSPMNSSMDSGSGTSSSDLYNNTEEEDDDNEFEYTEMNDIYTSLLNAKSTQENKYYYLKDNQKTSVNMKLRSSTNTELVKVEPRPNINSNNNNNNNCNSNNSNNRGDITMTNNDDIKPLANPSINDFIFIKKIAEGGYGRVDIYKKKTTKDMYAIKSVDIRKMKDKNLSATLKKETLILNEINSDYVVKCYYIFNDDQNYYYVMEYMPGGDLLGLLNKIELPQLTIQLIVAETILSLIYLHSKNIIHRDIKPENILISKDGHFKITDFGLSESEMRKNKYAILHSSHTFDQLEQSIADDVAVGTLPFMAPEMFCTSTSNVNDNINKTCSNNNISNSTNNIIGAINDYDNISNENINDNGINNNNNGNNGNTNSNQVEITETVDYWALGILIYHLYTFKIPFDAQQPSDVKDNIINMRIDWSHLESEVTKETYTNVAEAKDLIMHFLKKNPEERWSDAQFDLMKNHPFFLNFNWNAIKEIKDKAVISYVRGLAIQTQNEINEGLKYVKKRSIQKQDEKGLVSSNSNVNNDNCNNLRKESAFFCKRVDNLFSKSQDIVKEKFRKEELSINEDNNTGSIIDDLK